MNLITKIKDFIGSILLKQQLKTFKRAKQTNKFRFEEVKTVGIIFDATGNEDFELVKRYVAYLRENNKRVKVIGYFNSYGVPKLTYSKLEFDFFSNKETAITGRPLPVFISNFIEEPYDLLIDLNVKDHFALKYISSLSKAAFKVGSYQKEKPVLDMMIHTDATKNLSYFLKQIDTYIIMLNRVEVALN